jgi:hypothetical protein
MKEKEIVSDKDKKEKKKTLAAMLIESNYYCTYNKQARNK